MTSFMADGEKFALIALETRSEVNLPLTEITSGLWVSSTPMIGVDKFWREELGANRFRDFQSCTLFLLVKQQITDQAADQALRDCVWQFYAGMLLAYRYGTDQVPFLISGDCGHGGVNVRQVGQLEPACHASSNRLHRLTNDQVQRGAEIGQAIQLFPWVGAPRLCRVLHLYIKTRSQLEWMDRIHQYTRCLDGLTVPPAGGTGKKFAERMALIVGVAHQEFFEEIYRIRGAVEHLRENDYTEPFDRAERINLVKKAGIVEYVARMSIVRILETESLWNYFKTKSSLEDFWKLSLTERKKLWGDAIDPMNGIAGFDEEQYSDAELGKA